MAVYGFVKAIGRRIFDDETEAGERIKQAIERDNPGVRDLVVGFRDGIALLSGRAESAEAKEKAVWMAGNIKGVACVDADRLDVLA